MMINDEAEIRIVEEYRATIKRLKEENEKMKEKIINEVWQKYLKCAAEGKKPKYILSGALYSEVRVIKTSKECSTCKSTDEYKMRCELFATERKLVFCKKCIIDNSYTNYTDEFKNLFDQK